MKPGRELDALVGEKVMNGKRHIEHSVLAVDISAKTYTMGGGLEYPRYSTDIAAAWEVVEKVGRTWHGFHFLLQWTEPSWCSPQWEAGWYEWSYGEVESRAKGSGGTPAHAICVAALKAVGVDV